jgi:hypothetical protein
MKADADILRLGLEERHTKATEQQSQLVWAAVDRGLRSVLPPEVYQRARESIGRAAAGLIAELDPESVEVGGVDVSESVGSDEVWGVVDRALRVLFPQDMAAGNVMTKLRAVAFGFDGEWMVPAGMLRQWANQLDRNVGR